jgi:very-short-patch-repair endonuclease
MSKKIAGIVAAAEQRNGIVLIDDLNQLGISAGMRYHLVKEGVIRPVHRGVVFALGRATLDIATEIAAACWAVPDSWASGNTAAEYWGIRRIPRGRIELSTHDRRNPRLSGVRIRRTNFLDVEVVHLVTGGAVSTPAQTLFEISHETDDRTLASAFEDCVNRQLASVHEIRAFGSKAVKMGRPGSARFRRVILGRPDDLPFAMSHGELLLAVALESEDHRWRRQHHVRFPGGSSAYFDLARPDIKLGVEVDGALHDSTLAVHSDKHRDMAAAELGWQVVRPTTDDIERNLKSVVSRIAAIAKTREVQLAT